MQIEESAARRQARVDQGTDVVVGVNKYPAPDDQPVDILDVDNARVRDSQIARLTAIKASRDSQRLAAALAALTNAAKSGAGEPVGTVHRSDPRAGDGR